MVGTNDANWDPEVSLERRQMVGTDEERRQAWLRYGHQLRYLPETAPFRLLTDMSAAIWGKNPEIASGKRE